MKLRFTTEQFIVIGHKVIARYKELNEGARPEKIRVDFKTKKGDPFYWWICNYPDNFVPEAEKIILECAQEMHRKKRKRIIKPAFQAKPENP